MMLEREQGGGEFPGFLPLMLERPKGALRKPTTFFQSCKASSQAKHVVEMAYLFGNRASSMGTFLFYLPATLQRKDEGSEEGQCLGAPGPPGAAGPHPPVPP